MATPQNYRQRFFTRSAKYCAAASEDLELAIQYFGDDVVRIELTNLQHSKNCRGHLIRLFIMTGLLAAYLVSAVMMTQDSTTMCHKHIFIPTLLYMIFASYTFHTIFGMVRTERIFYSWDLALQMETERTFGRETVYCVNRGNLHDIVLNEVIENLDIKYMLILRTKGSLFRERPIIPLFNSMSPSFECLNHIRQHLHKCWLNNKSDRSERAYSKDKPSKVAS